MKLIKAIYGEDPTGRASVKLEFEDGPDGFLSDEVHRQLERGYGVFLGAHYEDLTSVPRPADESNAISAGTLKGYTSEPDVMQAAINFVTGAWQTGQQVWPLVED